METKINIAKILKNKPEGTKLWTDMFGSVTLYVVTDACDAFQVKHHNKDPWFDEDGKLYKEGVLCIYPSKSMRNWEKFSWKKGDVLISDCGFMCIFKEWASDDYTKFNGCYFDGMPNTETAKYSKVDNNIAYGYIRDIENRCGGKLNLETLEIEKKTKFEDGDIAFADYGNRQYVFIVSGETGLSEGYNSSIYLDLSSPTSSMAFRTSFFKKDLCELRLATEEEKTALFSALEKKCEAWDSEHKMIVDLPKNCEFKPFDKVICRDSDADIWKASFFSHYDERAYFPFFCNNCGYKYCLPYNDETAKLIGTTNNVEG
ncbi:hypothetical protein [Segatella copri]|uniref:Uncharacterized protein n=1 Tax=Segatella copri TaxID=165179 RepID=A0AA93BLG2_9BACT|nr:hypothetical protein [Segatella copri]RHA86795.1 hypothetical protein DW916_07990 [Segatella copri]